MSQVSLPDTRNLLGFLLLSSVGFSEIKHCYIPLEHSKSKQKINKPVETRHNVHLVREGTRERMRERAVSGVWTVCGGRSTDCLIAVQTKVRRSNIVESAALPTYETWRTWRD